MKKQVEEMTGKRLTELEQAWGNFNVGIWPEVMKKMESLEKAVSNFAQQKFEEQRDKVKEEESRGAKEASMQMEVSEVKRKQM